MIRLYHGDCLAIMPKLADKSVDLILADLPYGTSSCKWDIVIPFEPLWEQYNRIIKDNGVIALFGSEPFSSKIIISNLKCFREELIWLKNKAGSGLQAKQKHIKVHEKILIFSKSGSYQFYPQKWLVDKKEFLTQRKTFKNIEVGNNIYNKMTRTQKVDDGSRNPISILSTRVPYTPSKTKQYINPNLRLHPTQKPVALLEYLIKTYTQEGDVVLDNAMGSGSTGIACVNTGRSFIGIEKEEKYYLVAYDLINNLMEDMKNDTTRTR